MPRTVTLTAAQTAALRVLAPRDESGMYRTPHAFTAAAVAAAVGGSEQGATMTLTSLVRRHMIERIPAYRMPEGRVGYQAIARGVYALAAVDAS